MGDLGVFSGFVFFSAGFVILLVFFVGGLLDGWMDGWMDGCVRAYQIQVTRHCACVCIVIIVLYKVVCVNLFLHVILLFHSFIFFSFMFAITMVGNFSK